MNDSIKDKDEKVAKVEELFAEINSSTLQVYALQGELNESNKVCRAGSGSKDDASMRRIFLPWRFSTFNAVSTLGSGKAIILEDLASSLSRCHNSISFKKFK